MADVKHVGRSVRGNRKCIVAFRVVPNDSDHCLVVFTENLEAADHDTLINLVESNAGQNAYELGEVLARTSLSDGRNMLAAFDRMGKLSRVATTEINLTPNFSTSVNLAELNTIIAEQKGVTVADLALQDGSAKKENQSTPSTQPVIDEPITDSTGVLTDDQLAAQYRSQADRLYKEAKSLREQAEELSPTKKKATAKKKDSA